MRLAIPNSLFMPAPTSDTLAMLVSISTPRAPMAAAVRSAIVRALSMEALGTGAMDIGSLIAAGGSNTQWVIVELDRCDTDMEEAVEKSINYLIKEGYGHGQKR